MLQAMFISGSPHTGSRKTKPKSGFLNRPVVAIAWFLAVFFALCRPGSAQTLAFPGAQGFGRFATGGRNGTVYHVTSLADSGTGTFRDAVGQPNRTIVFDVGGTITLQSAVSCSSALTIAGQTAPGGIAIIGHEVSFSVLTNEIVRYLRLRPGSLASSTEDGINMGDGTNMIYDHISIEFAPYNNIDAHGNYTGGNQITIQNSILADPIGQQFNAHTEALGNTFSWCYDIFSSAHNRNPLAKVNTIFVNNVVYNYQAGYTVADTSGDFSHDIVNNYFITGPSTTSAGDDFFQMDGNQSIYATGNLLDSAGNGTLGGSATAPGGVTVLNAPWSTNTANIPTFDPTAAYKNDVSLSGALPRDQVDQLVINEVSSLGTSGQMWTSQSATGLGNNGYGTLTGAATPLNSSGDGIPDYWKLANGLNVNVAYPLTNTADGYTLLEHYLNWLAAPHALTETNSAAVVALAQYTAGFATNSTYAVSGASNGVVTLTSGSTAIFTPNKNFVGLGSFVFTVSDGVTIMTNALGVCVTPLPAPQAVTWHGDGVANNWDTTSSNWFNGTNLVPFQSGDTVTFDDTGSDSPAISLVGALAPAVMTVNAAQNYTFSGTGVLNGSMTLTKLDTGILTMDNTNSFSGGIVLNNGLLDFGTAAAVPASGMLTLNNTSIVTVTTATSLPNVLVNGTNSITGNGNSGTGIATLDDAGVLTLFISGGSKVFDLTGTMTGSGNLILGSSPMTLRFNGTAGDGNAIFNLGTGDAAAIVRGTTTTAIALGGLTGGSGTLLQGDNSTGGANMTYTIGGANANTEFDGAIANGTVGTVALTKIGSGTLTLSGNSFYSGPTIVSNGTLTVNGSLGGSTVTVSSGATLSGTGALNGGVVVNAGAVISPAGTGSVGTLSVSNLTLNSATLDFDLSSSPSSGNDQIFLPNGLLTMTGTENFQFNLLNQELGDGTYVLITGATNSSTAGVGFTDNLPSGARQTFSMQRPGSGDGSAYVWLVVSGPSPASLIWQGTNGGSWDLSTTNWLNGVFADKFYNLDAVTFNDTSINGAVTLNATLQPVSMLVTNNSLPYVFSGTGALTGAGTLTKAGSSTLTVSATNSSYTGNIFLTGGWLTVDSGAGIGSGTLSISGGSTFSLAAGSTLTLSGNPILVPAGQTGTINSGALGNGFSGNFSSGNAASILNLTGSVSLGGTSSSQLDGFTGTLNVQPGATLRFSPNSSGNTYGSLSPTLVINGTLQPRNDGNTIQLGAFTGSGTLSGPQSDAGNGGTLYVIGGNNSSASFSGIISSNTAVPGSVVSVNKIGSGTLLLSGNSTYTGITTITGGELIADNTSGSATGSGSVLVGNGATLSGYGSIAGATTVEAGATLAPGNSAGTLTFNGGLTLVNGTILQFGLGTNSNQVVVNGSLFLGGILNITNIGGFGVGSYPLFSYNPSGGLTLSSLTIGSAPAGYNYRVMTNTPGVVNLIVAPTTAPKFGRPTATGGNLILSGGNGVPLGNYVVLTTTNLSLPLAHWTPLLTNQFDAYGNFSFTNSLGTFPQAFYQLQLQ
jgi:autotransporter-associated beta strand protein